MSGAARGAWVLGLHLAVAGAVAPAAERQHTVAVGESASAIAKRYYGDYALTDLLLRFNGRSGTTIHPGEKLRVPYCSVHTVRSGDSWSQLAQRYLGRASLWPEIAELNGLGRRDPLRVGQRIVMPVVLSHRLERGESLAGLAERFYDDPGRGRLLQSFNRIDDPRTLSVGRSIEVPLVTLLLAESRATRPEPESAADRPPRATKTAAKAPPEPAAADEAEPPSRSAAAAEAAAAEARRRQAIAAFLTTVRAARRAYDAGEYDRASELLESQRGAAVEDRDGPGRAEYWQLLAFVQIAFDRQDEACAAWRSLDELSPRVKLDPDLVSPKIRESQAACSPR